MTPDLIKIYLITRGITQKQLRQRIEANHRITCTSDILARTISGERRNEQVRDAMAAELGLPKDELFGQDFEAVTTLRKSA